MKHKLVILLICVGIMLSQSHVFAAGFNLYEMGSKSMALAGAFSATADDASAIYFNPAGIAQLEGMHVYLGGTLLIPNVKFSGVSPYPGYGVEEETKDRLFFPPGLYLTKQFSQKLVGGVGLYAPFALATEWDDAENFTGRYISQKAELRGIYVSPSVAYKVSDMISLGANLNVVYSAVELRRVQNQPFNGQVLDVANVKLDATNGLAFGFDFGALIKPVPKVQLGFVYRSKVTNEYEGDAEFEQIMTGDPALDAIVAQGLPTAADGSNEIGAASEIPFPAQTVGAVKYMATDKLSLEFNLVFFAWSSFDELPITFSSEAEEGDVNTPEDSVIEEEYEDAFQYRLGLEYKVTPELALRLGYVYDETPVPDESVSPFLPDNARNDYSFGIGYKLGDLNIDVAYMFVDFGTRDTEGKNRDNYNGSYNSVANLFGVSIGRSF